MNEDRYINGLDSCFQSKYKPTGILRTCIYYAVLLDCVKWNNMIHQKENPCPGVILQGDVGEMVSQNCLTSPFFKLRE